MFNYKSYACYVKGECKNNQLVICGLEEDNKVFSLNAWLNTFEFELQSRMVYYSNLAYPFIAINAVDFFINIHE